MTARQKNAVIREPRGPIDVAPTPKPRRIPAMPEQSITASQAKTHLLQLLKDLDARGEPVTITKRGKPIARLVPIQAQPASDIFGYMKGTFSITGDIVGPEPDLWEAMS